MSDFKIVKLVDPIQLNLAGGLNFQGDYDNATAYVVGDVVTYNGSSYAATQGTTGNLPTDVSNWQLLAEKGDPLTVNAGTNIDIDTISATEITVNTVVDDDAALTANSATAIASQKATKSYADTKVTSNASITGATKTKITYDAKGLVTAGADATTADIADSTNKRYVTDANLTVIGNTSGTNTGDQILPTRDSLGLDTDDTVTFANLSGTNTGDETQTTIKTKLGAASSSADGYLTSTDWSTFNNKQNALGFAPEDVANKSTSTSLGSSNTLYPSQNAVKVYVDNLLGNENALVYKGTLDCSTNPNYPAASAGNLYIVSVAGKIGGASGTVVDVGDMIICNTDNTVTGTQAAVGQYWNIIEKNIVGAVTGPASSVDSNVAFFDGVTGKVIKDSGLTLSGTNTGDNATNTQYSGLDAAKVNKAGDTMSGNLNMGTNKLIGGTGVADILKLQGTTGNGTAGSAAIQLLTGNNGATTALTVLNNGNVGIGTTSPGAQLQVVSSAAATIGQIIRGASAQTADLLQIQDSSANKLMVVSSGGNVGIGTTTPGVKLDVNGIVRASNSSITAGDGAFIAAGGNPTIVQRMQRTGGGYGYSLFQGYADNTTSGLSSFLLDYGAIGDLNSGVTAPNITYSYFGVGSTASFLNTHLRLYNNSDKVVSVDGKLGVGTTAPAVPLEVNGIVRADRVGGPTQYIQLDGGDGNNTALRAVASNKFLYIDNADISGANLYNAIVFRNGTAGDTERMRVDANGNVGIGTPSPGAQLQVVSSAAATIGQIIRGASAQTADLLQIQDSSANKLMVVSSGGKVGIGTTSPGEKLDVSGTVKATGYKSSDGSAGVSGSFTTTDGKTITIKDGLVVSIL